jgi:Protein of unknown function (DUF2865)
MSETTFFSPARGIAVAVLVLLGCAQPAAAQFGYTPPPPPGYTPPPAAGARNPACLRYESQLATLDRGPSDPAKLAEIKRSEDAAAKQQADLDRLNQQAQRLGCQGRGFFALFSNQSPQCGPLDNQIQQARANMDRLMGEQQRLQGNSADREGQRRAILVALGQNNCGPQYARYTNQGPGGFFENLFGGVQTAPDVPLAGTYRTLCVRTCDGFYFPISYSTVPGKFADDEKLCQRLCPAAETALFTHRNPGEDINRAVSVAGQPYTQLPNAFAYRKQYNAACSCRAPGQSWAQALKQFDDQTIERGDIVVQTEEQAKALSQPRVDAQGKPIKPEAGGRGQPKNVAVTPAAEPVSAEPAEEDPSKRKVRSVGPVFLPAR